MSVQEVFPAYQCLAVGTPQPHVLWVALDRPQALNAINTLMGRELLDLWTRLAEDAAGIRCVVLTGSGDRAFCAGGDLKERNGMSDEQWRRQHELFERAFVALLECPVPVIAAVNGHAYGGGCETVLGCDFVYAVRQARFALVETRLGIMPGGGGTQTLARAVGERRAKELILSARPFSAGQAEQWGLVNQLCDSVGELRDRVLATAGEIAANAPLSVRQAKKSVHHGLQTDLLSGYRYEIEAYNRLVVTEDRHEGVRAFNEKRAPLFKGR
ncbi:enoyl-CoA hydratase/isomerase family protein [Candidimonas nitroreducens]|uniref:Enoyl-CoA hydratase n=1 Tax=Candidimonas nitroreducens TaxID=683354 RepID=A0A225M1L6_9BURK|nr:enoyl-CoA hydratase-related protein [Candidimonas nitroreducens]OWT55217.1 enoyl-CoA hydratase [Candidimonas nitroreducens]